MVLFKSNREQLLEEPQEGVISSKLLNNHPGCSVEHRLEAGRIVGRRCSCASQSAGLWKGQRDAFGACSGD